MARIKNTPRQRNVAADGGAQHVWEAPTNAQFINVSLNDDDREWLQGQLGELWFHVDALFVDAEKHSARISVVPDKKSGRFNATFTSYARDSHRYGLILSVRASTPTLALYCLAYVNLHKEGAWQKITNTATDMFG